MLPHTVLKTSGVNARALRTTRSVNGMEVSDPLKVGIVEYVEHNKVGYVLFNVATIEFRLVKFGFPRYPHPASPTALTENPAGARTSALVYPSERRVLKRSQATRTTRTTRSTLFMRLAHKIPHGALCPEPPWVLFEELVVSLVLQDQFLGLLVLIEPRSDRFP